MKGSKRAFLGAIVLGGAFVITMAGGQYYATKDFVKFIQLDSEIAKEVLGWLSALSCGYVMAFTRGSKIYQDIYKYLEKKSNEQAQPLNAEMKTVTIGSELSNGKTLSQQTEKKTSTLGKVIGSVGGGAGVVRGILLGYIGAESLLKGMQITDLFVIYAIASYVCISNTIAYVTFTLKTAIDNGEFIIKFFKEASHTTKTSQQLAAPQNFKWKKINTIVMTVPSLVGAFAYFNFLSHTALKQMPFLSGLPNSASWAIASSTTAITVLVGGLTKGVQYFRYLTKQETNRYKNEELKNISSPKIVSHRIVGNIYAVFFTVVTFMGLMYLSDSLLFDYNYAIPISALIALASGVLEYAFSSRIMINDAKISVYEQRMFKTAVVVAQEENLKNEGIANESPQNNMSDPLLDSRENRNKL
jgi:hypothetical protein